MSKANAEQVKAIEHSGGVLLSAGAGSGKTFVLTEHMIYIARKSLLELSPDLDQFKIDINSKFRKIVMMTFTNKAAGEIELRVKRRFQSERDSFNSEDAKERWDIVIDALKNLTITTIHGFCFKLIRQGFFTSVNPNISLSNEAELKKQIEVFFDDWVMNLPRDKSDLIIKSKTDIIKSLLNVFMDPSLRRAWKNDLKESPELFNDLFLSDDSFQLALFSGKMDMLDNSFEGKGWYDELFHFMRNFKKEKYSKEDFKNLFYYFYEKNFKIPVTPRAKGVSEQLKSLYISYKNVKDFLKSNKDDIHNYFSNPNVVSEYSELFKQLVNYVEIEYQKAELFTFSDLEYITLMGLQDFASQSAVGKEYEYLIIDEFQDTSFVQFEIIKKVIQGDFNRLFCVGDPKQAIYGFRGGELGVFEEVGRNVPLNLSLLNNYRSDKHIIDFNNQLFEHIFSLGVGYENKDRFQVKVDYQNFPDTKEDLGELYKVRLDFEIEEDKLSVDDVEFLEAQGILSDIKYQLNETTKNICILYRKLKPSKVLSKLLIENNIPFISQVKVPVCEDPIVSIFYSLIKFKFNSARNSEKLLLFELQSLINLLFANDKVIDILAINKFFSKAQNFGYLFAFVDLLEVLEIVSSNTSNSISTIKELIKISGGQENILLELLEKLEVNSYNLDFHFGEGQKRVYIMTAHASKGLQFNHVILGGIYTNESANQHYSFMGATPGSFQWRVDKYAKQKYKTPQFILENNIRKLKEFSETKRLFYVAATRAENSLSYIDINFNEAKFSPYKNTWINGVNHFFDEIDLPFCHIRQAQISLEEVWDKRSSYLVKLPLFHLDTLGASEKRSTNEILILPELSVTRFSLAAVCARKFYLKNTLKLNGDENLFAEIKEEDEFDELSSRQFSGKSAMERGSEIHEQISQVIKKNLTLDKTSSEHRTQISWALDNFKLNCEKTNLISEEEIKFDVFGHMVSGIPDLIVSNDDDEIYEIWDFKTGKIKPESNENYWAQLKLYAFYLFQNKKIQNSVKQIKIVLCYVDERKNLEQTVSKNSVENYVQKLLLNSQAPNLKNANHCEQCEFNNICNNH